MGSTREWPTRLQRVVEEAERCDWKRYALGRPAVSGPGLRSRIAALLAEADIPALRLRAALLAIDADNMISETVARVNSAEGRGGDPAADIVELFAGRERLARESGHVGYAELALAADGLSRTAVAAELEAAERAAIRDAAREVVVEHSSDLSDEVLVRDRILAFFSPLLEDVEVRLDVRAAVAGMCKALHWPDRIAVVVRAAAPNASLSDRLESLGTTAHELGHAAQWRARAARGLGFLDFLSLTSVAAETAADLAERILFETDVGADAALPRGAWAAQRAETMLRQIGRARFELGAYAAALDDPASLPRLWGRDVDPAQPDGWSRDGHGFYTEDPMRRYAYALAYLRSEALLARLDRPLTRAAITALL